MQRAVIPHPLSDVAVVVLSGGEILKYREKLALPTFYNKIHTVFHSASAFQFVCVCAQFDCSFLKKCKTTQS